MKEIFVFLSRREYINIFKEPNPINDEFLKIYYLFYVIINNDQLTDLFRENKEKFWKKISEDFVRNSLDGEELSQFFYLKLNEGLKFDVNSVLKIDYIWNKEFIDIYEIDIITKRDPISGIILLIIQKYLEFCGIIDYDGSKKGSYYQEAKFKNEILVLNKKILKLANLFKKIIISNGGDNINI